MAVRREAAEVNPAITGIEMNSRKNPKHEYIKIMKSGLPILSEKRKYILRIKTNTVWLNEVQYEKF